MRSRTLASPLLQAYRRIECWQVLGELLARMGLPLKFCKQDFCALSAALLYNAGRGDTGDACECWG